MSQTLSSAAVVIDTLRVKWVKATMKVCIWFLCNHGIDFVTCNVVNFNSIKGAQWLSGRVLDSRPKGRGFEPHRRHCVVVLKQDTFI